MCIIIKQNDHTAAKAKMEGMRNIEEISVGEEVYAENTISEKPEKRKVMRISH